MHEITVKMSVSDQDIDDLMVTAFEGGINYWCGKVRIVEIPEGMSSDIIASDLISKGGSLRLYDAESSDSWLLTRDMLLKGLTQYCSKSGYSSMQDLMDNYDADTADQIIQYALFNEIVFG